MAFSRSDRFSKKKTAFSLIEILIALGIFAFAVVVILGLLSGLLTSSRESWQETRAAQIARQVFVDLQPPAGTNVGLLVVGGSNVVRVDLSGITALYTNQVYYTVEGLPVTSTDPDASFRADLSIEPLTNRIALQQVRLDVRAIASGTNVSPFKFFTRITPTVMPAPTPSPAP